MERYGIDLNKMAEILSAESTKNVSANDYIRSEERLFVRKIKRSHWPNIKKALILRLEATYDGCKRATQYHITKSLDEFKLKNMEKYDPEELEEMTKDVLQKCVIFVDKQVFIDKVVSEIENGTQSRFVEMFTLDTKYYKKVRPIKFWKRLVHILLIVGAAAATVAVAKGGGSLGVHSYADSSMFAHDMGNIGKGIDAAGKSYSTSQIMTDLDKQSGKSKNPYFTFTTDMPKRFLNAITLAFPNLKYRIGVKIDIRLID